MALKPGTEGTICMASQYPLGMTRKGRNMRRVAIKTRTKTVRSRSCSSAGRIHGYDDHDGAEVLVLTLLTNGVLTMQIWDDLGAFAEQVRETCNFRDVHASLRVVPMREDAEGSDGIRHEDVSAALLLQLTRACHVCSCSAVPAHVTASFRLGVHGQCAILASEAACAPARCFYPL